MNREPLPLIGYLMKTFLTHKHWFMVVLSCAFSVIVLIILNNYTIVRLQVETSQTSNFRIYWTTVDDAAWSENKSIEVRVNTRKNRYLLPINVPILKISNIRLDPNNRKGIKTTIYDISFYHMYSRPIHFNTGKAFSTLKPNEQINEIRLGKNISFKSNGRDPFLYLDLAKINTHVQPYSFLAQSLFLAFLIILSIGCFKVVTESYRFVPLTMIVVATAILGMATIAISAYTHPDELTHVAAAEYYYDHYTPPEVCSESTRHTYSEYGISRLNSREIAYYIAGRYLQLVDFIPTLNYLKLRYFNVGLFFILMILAIRQPQSRLLFLPLLLTPQAWYLFSYYNSDAFSLFAVVIAAYQVFLPQSMLRRLLRGERPKVYIIWVILLGVMVAMQFWVKLNYIFFPIFLFMLALAWLIHNHRWPEIRYAMPVLAASLMGIALFSSWNISRHAVNGFELDEATYDCREQTSATLYHPNTPLNKTHPNLRLRDKGVSLHDMLKNKEWEIRIFYTGLGAYGLTEYLNSFIHYEVVSMFIVLLFLYVMITVGIKGNRLARLAVLSSLAAILGLTFAAALNNWTQDFQPQGRYLMPYLPILGSLMVMYRYHLNVAVVSLLSSIPLLLGLYSFFAVALVEIPKF